MELLKEKYLITQPLVRGTKETFFVIGEGHARKSAVLFSIPSLSAPVRGELLWYRLELRREGWIDPDFPRSSLMSWMGSRPCGLNRAPGRHRSEHSTMPATA